MTISFWLTSTTRHINSEDWGKVPMGGAEISAVNLGKELLKKGHVVKYFLQRCEPFEKENLIVRRHDQVFDEEHEYFICVRPHPVLQGNFDGIKLILWSGDAFDQPSNDIFYDKGIAGKIDAFVFKSEWQKNKIVEKYFNIDKSKAIHIYNGINTHYYNDSVNRQKGRFIHASTWYRGLKNFISIWPKILEQIPDAEIHVFSKTTLYSEVNEPKNVGWYSIAEQLVNIPNIVLREPIPQNLLAKEMQKAQLMLYPNTGFVESSCGSALESLAAGTPVVTTKRAGLIETVGDAGILVEENENWEDEFVKQTIKLYKDNSLWGEKSQKAKEKAMEFSWENRVMEWENFLRSL